MLYKNALKAGVFLCNFGISLCVFADTDVVDQQQTIFSGVANAFGNSDPMAQIFTARMNGLLDKISINAAPCWDSWGKPCNFDIQIQTVDGNGNPSGNVIGHGYGREPQPASNGDAFAWADVQLSSPALVQSGVRYAMVLRADWWMQVTFGLNTGFNGAAKHWQSGGWRGYGSNGNLVFKTWVLPGVPSVPFQATIQSDTTNECLIFSGNGLDVYPSRYLWGDARNFANCGFNTKQEMINNKQAIWRFFPVEGNKYTITNASNGVEQCLIFSGNGTNKYPSRYLWGNGTSTTNCGFATTQDLLNNKQAIWTVESVGSKFVIKNASSGKQMCLIFSGNGTDRFPSRYLWGDGSTDANCGFSTTQDLLNNKQAVWTISPL